MASQKIKFNSLITNFVFIMKRFFLSTLSLAIIIAFTSCGGSSGTDSGSTEKGAENVDSKAEANEIISYTNEVIDYLNGSGDWLRSNEDELSKMVDFMSSKKKASYYSSLSPDVSFNFNAGKKDVTNPPAVMSAEEQEYFKKNMTEYKIAYSRLKVNGGDLLKYIRNEDYKDDDFAKGKMLADSIEICYKYLVATKSDLYGKIDAVTEKAEKIILEDHPLREPIFALKEDLKNFEELGTIYSDYSQGKATPEQVDAAYQKVAASVEKNRALYTEVLNENKVKSDYDGFYNSCDDALATFRKVLRKVKENKKIADSDFRTINSDYSYLIKAYNRFND